MNLLFICNLGKHRSRTAAEILANEYNTDYAGLYQNFVTEKQVEWADIIFVMEDFQRKIISERFPKLYLKKRILCLNIMDCYSYMDEELIKIIKEKIKTALKT